MGRKRVIDTDELLFDEELYEAVGKDGLWLYVRLWSIAEDFGGYEPKYGSISLKTGVLKLSTLCVKSLCEKFVKLGKVVTYEINGKTYHWIKNFLKHQRLNNPAIPTLPLPPWVICEIRQYKSGKKYASYEVDWDIFASATSSLPVDDLQLPGPLETETKRNETKRNETRKDIVDSANPPSSVLRTDPCIYCGVKPGQVNGLGFEYDHFIPRDAGGTDDSENLIWSCSWCNILKSNKIFKDINSVRQFIHRTLWEKNKERYKDRRLVCFGGKPPKDFQGVIFSVQNLAKLWNEMAPPELSKVNLPFSRPDRDMNKIRAVVKRHPDMEWWEKVIIELHNLPFVRGDNDRGWRITFDVMVRDAEKILDGKYASGRKLSKEPKGFAGLREWNRRKENA